MSKTGQLYYTEMEKRDILINELTDACYKAKEWIEKELRETDPTTGRYIEKSVEPLWNSLCSAIALVESER